MEGSQRAVKGSQDQAVFTAISTSIGSMGMKAKRSQFGWPNRINLIHWKEHIFYNQ